MFHTKNILNRMMGLSLLASLGFAAFLSLALTDAALAATAPSLGSESTYGVVSSTFTNSNTPPQTIINGQVCCTTCTLPLPLTITGGPPEVPCAPLKNADQGLALGILNGQACTSLTPGVPLDAVVIGLNPAGTFPPGCYSSTAAMDITVGTTVTLNGAGVYVFRSSGALTTGANSIVALANGACESDVFWAFGGGTSLGATSTFAGNIYDDAGISIGHFANLVGRALAFNGTVTTDANTITVPTCVSAPPLPGAPTLGKTFNPVAIIEGCGLGDFSTLTITLSNPNATAATITSLTENLPPGTQVASTPNAGNTCGGLVSATAGGSTVTLTGGSIPAGSPGTCTVQVDVCAATEGSYVNTLIVGALKTSNGNNPAEALATLIVNQTPGPGPAPFPPTIGKSFDPVSITVGNTSTLTITLSNPNTIPANNASFTDTLPPGVVIAATPSITNTCGGSVSAIAGGDTVTLTLGSIPAASIGPPAALGACTVTVDVTVTAPSGGSFHNTLIAGALTTSLGPNVLPAIATLNGIPLIIPPVSIPTLNEWGMIIFMVLVGLMSIYYMRRKRREALN